MCPENIMFNVWKISYWARFITHTRGKVSVCLSYSIQLWRIDQLYYDIAIDYSRRFRFISCNVKPMTPSSWDCLSSYFNIIVRMNSAISEKNSSSFELILIEIVIFFDKMTPIAVIVETFVLPRNKPWTRILFTIFVKNLISPNRVQIYKSIKLKMI